MLPASLSDVRGLPEIGEGVKWDGSPTKRALKLLAVEARTPGFDVAEAVAILDMMGDDGYTLTAACRAMGVRRSTVLAWKRLVPEFGALLEEVERGLGGFQRDRAVEMLDGGDDAAAVGVRLKVAGSFDKTINGGETKASGGVVVQVVQFGSGLPVTSSTASERR